MSTDYFFACKQCKECIHVAQDGLSGFSFYSKEPECMKELTPFFERHYFHKEHIAFVSEHEIETGGYGEPGDYSEVEWRPM